MPNPSPPEPVTDSPLEAAVGDLLKAHPGAQRTTAAKLHTSLGQLIDVPGTPAGPWRLEDVKDDGDGLIILLVAGINLPASIHVTGSMFMPPDTPVALIPEPRVPEQS